MRVAKVECHAATDQRRTTESEGDAVKELTVTQVVASGSSAWRNENGADERYYYGVLWTGSGFRYKKSGRLVPLKFLSRIPTDGWHHWRECECKFCKEVTP